MEKDLNNMSDMWCVRAYIRDMVGVTRMTVRLHGYRPTAPQRVYCSRAIANAQAKGRHRYSTGTLRRASLCVASTAPRSGYTRGPNDN